MPKWNRGFNERNCGVCFDTHTFYEYIFDKEPKVG